MTEQKEDKNGNFDHLAENYDEKATRVWKFHTHVVDAIVQRAPTKNHTLLEFGCGTGNICLPLSAHMGHVYGVDISANMLNKAQEKIQQSSLPNASVQQMDLTATQQLVDIGYPEHYDWVVCCMTLHHLPDPMAKLELFQHMLTPEGTLVIVEFGNSADGQSHSHAHHKHHGHEHQHQQHEDQQEHPASHGRSDVKDNASHSHSHSHAHSHGHHSQSHDDESAAAPPPPPPPPTRESLKEKFGIFTDGFNIKLLQTALNKLGLSKFETSELPPMEGMHKEHPFYGLPIMIIFASK